MVSMDSPTRNDQSVVVSSLMYYMLLIILYSTLRAQKNLQVTYTIHKHSCISTLSSRCGSASGKAIMVLIESLNSRIEPLENHLNLKDIGENLFFSCSESCSWIDFLQPT